MKVWRGCGNGDDLSRNDRNIWDGGRKGSARWGREEGVLQSECKSFERKAFSNSFREHKFLHVNRRNDKSFLGTRRTG